MVGLSTFYGNPVSEYADRHMDLSGIGKLMTMSGRSELDALMGMNFRHQFGVQNIFELPTTVEGAVAEKHRISDRNRGQRLFGAEVTYNQLAGWLGRGAEIRTTPLSEEYTFEQYKAANDGRYVLLFALDASGRLRVFTPDVEITPGPAWKIVSLILPEAQST